LGNLPPELLRGVGKLQQQHQQQQQQHQQQQHQQQPQQQPRMAWPGQELYNQTSYPGPPFRYLSDYMSPPGDLKSLFLRSALATEFNISCFQAMNKFLMLL
jgi:hypothetical protein